jgi:hypothetical protein
VCRLLSERTRRGFAAVFFREERPSPPHDLLAQAEFNIEIISELVPHPEFVRIQIFALDGAVVGGREVAKVVEQIGLAEWTDVVVDFSALSKGVTFPVVRQLLDRSRIECPHLNIHLMVTDEAATDAEIQEVASDRAEMVAGFAGRWWLTETQEAARLWLPQLIRGQNVILDRIHRYVRPDDVCPILPFPAANPRLPDELMEEYASEMQSVWEVEPRDLIYADERNPVDLYRTILKIDDARARVFQETGGSVIVLSPLGSKVLAIGSLMAALERDFPVAYVEAMDYSVNFERMKTCRTATGDVVHVWLQGEAYAD